MTAGAAVSVSVPVPVVVPAASVIVEALGGIILAQAYLEKFGGDSLAELQAAIDVYQNRGARLAPTPPPPAEPAATVVDGFKSASAPADVEGESLAMGGQVIPPDDGLQNRYRQRVTTVIEGSR